LFAKYAEASFFVDVPGQLPSFQLLHPALADIRWGYFSQQADSMMQMAAAIAQNDAKT